MRELDALAGVKQYVERIIQDPQLEGMKAFVLDDSTTRIVSMVMSQSHILERQVYLVERLEKPASDEPMPHLNAAVFVRPSRSNIDKLVKELKKPRYAHYHIFFSNILAVEDLERLAEADENEVVVQIQEHYADYLAVTDSLFHFRLAQSLSLSLPNAKQSDAGTLERNVDGLLSILLSMKKRPVIRYQKGTPNTAEKVAREVSARMQLEQDGLFDFRRPETPPLLYVLDRKNDPVTPLLTQWCYQAMVHELLGLEDNRVDLSQVPGIRKDMTEIVLSVTSDDFFKKHMHANFGDLGLAVKALVDEYQRQQASHNQENIQSVEDMQRLLDNYPAIRSQSVAVSKHVTLMSELARRVEVDQLMDVSQLEQEMSCGDDHNAHLKELIEKIKNANIQPQNKLRLAMLYALRYETHASVQLKTVKDLLKSPGGLSPSRIQLIDAVLEYAGASVRSGDLFGDRGLKKFMRHVTQGLQGVPNVYAQHVPPLIRTLESVLKGQLLDTEFGIVNGNASPGAKKVQDVIVFVCGGVTFEEAMKVAELNAKVSANGQRVLLGGSSVLNSSSFLSELAEASGIEESGKKTRGGRNLQYQDKDL